MNVIQINARRSQELGEKAAAERQLELKRALEGKTGHAAELQKQLNDFEEATKFHQVRTAYRLAVGRSVG